MATEATVNRHMVSATTVTTAVTGKMIIHCLIGLKFSCFFSEGYSMLANTGITVQHSKSYKLSIQT